MSAHYAVVFVECGGGGARSVEALGILAKGAKKPETRFHSMTGY
jgi:hypothetical protein